MYGRGRRWEFGDLEGAVCLLAYLREYLHDGFAAATRNLAVISSMTLLAKRSFLFLRAVVW